MNKEKVEKLIYTVFVSEGKEREEALKLLEERGICLAVKNGDEIITIPWDKVRAVKEAEG